MYRIKKIDNTGSQAQPFVFKSSNLVLITDSKTTNEQTNEQTDADSTLLGSQLASPITVPEGRVAQKPKGPGLRDQGRPRQRSQDAGRQDDPIHTIDPKQPVSMDRASGRTSEAVVQNALPGPLQSLCNTK